MKIRDYLEQYGCVLNDIAKSVGVKKHTIWLISSGRLNPSASLAEKISDWSGGKIKVHEIRNCTKTCSKGCACSKGDN